MNTPGVILLADDQVMVRNLVRTILQREDYFVLSAADGSEALELSRLHTGAINLLLTDLIMPRMDGISAYRQISAERPNIKVLFMSGHMSGQLAIPPPLPFLPKPFFPHSLRTKVLDILAGPPLPGDNLQMILVVDHKADRLERTKNILLNAGYGVVTACSVEEAEGVSDSIATIDLIISGVIFPGHSGVHLAEHVDASERDVNTLLISHFHPDLLRDVAGFSEQSQFLQNPFTPEALLARVRELLG